MKKANDATVVAKEVVKAIKPKSIGRVKAAELINNSKGRIFTVVFTKVDGTLRTMNCRKGVVKGIVKEVNRKKKAVDTENLGLITVYDMQEKGYKKVNLQTISSLKINKEIYKVK